MFDTYSRIFCLAANDLVFKPKSGYLEITKDDGNYIEGKFEYVMSNQLGIQHPNSEVVDGKFKCKILE